MATYITGFISIFVIGFTTVTGWNNHQNNNVISALRAGDVESIASYFSATEIDLTLPKVSDTFDKATAKKHLAIFFKNNPPIAFEALHEGTSKGAKSQFLIGNLKTKSKDFRVNISMKNGLIHGIIIN